MQMIHRTFRPAFAYETITIDNTAGGKALTATTYTKQVGPLASDTQKARKAFISVETAPIRFQLVPGVTPTDTTNGHEAGQDTSFELEGNAIVDFRAIRSTGTSATIRVTYYL